MPDRHKPLFERMEEFITFCCAAVDRAFLAAGVEYMGRTAPLSQDDRAYEQFVANCTKLGIEPATRLTWEKITRSVPDNQGVVGTRVTNYTGG